VGQGVLRECLLDPGVERVLCVGRTATGQSHAKLRELVHKDLSDFSAIEGELAGYDACYFCLGISSAGMTEEAYTRVTFDFTMAAAQAIAKQSPGLVFVFVSGRGTDEGGRLMWARVKGRAENALLKMPFKAAYMFRPGYIHPVHGGKSKTRLYRWFYAVLTPLYPLLKVLFPGFVTTTEHMGRAMLEVTRNGAPKTILESRDIEAIGAGAPAPKS
jgi:uncharacterized protein YbjT (DUF2867 family)